MGHKGLMLIITNFLITNNVLQFKVIRSRLVKEYVEAGLIFQKCEIRYFSNDDDT